MTRTAVVFCYLAEICADEVIGNSISVPDETE
jgi:hypothetical protein